MKKFIILFLPIILIFYGSGFAQVTTPEAVQATIEAKPTIVTAEVAAPKAEIPAVAKKFMDVPDDHWAASSVYDLVNLGVTQGYPDGTFRGNNNITRYETAMFLSKLAAAIGASQDETNIAIEKLRDDLRAEIRVLRAEIAELKRIPEEAEEKPITGLFNSKIMFGNLITRNTSIEGEYAPVGPLVRYRLKTTFMKNLGYGAKLKVNLDTMDSGFGGGASDLSTRILDIEGDMQLNFGLENPVDVKVTSGPGPIVHTEEADASGNYIARSENNVVYIRPWNSIKFSSKVWGMDMGLGYIARRVSSFGEVDVNQIATSIGFNMPPIFFVPTFHLDTNIDYLFAQPQAIPAGPSDTKFTFVANFKLNPRSKAAFIYSFGHGDAPENALYGIEFDLLDSWDTGTNVLFKYRKIGAEYLYENAQLAEDLFAGLDVFNRYIGNGGGLGVVDIDGELSQIITETTRLVGRADWRLAPDNSYGKDHPQCLLVLEGGFAWDIATDTLLEALYRVESIPSAADLSTDLTQIGLSFKY